ncbi:hypothetical protein, partial [Enterobacter intestinihominis]
FFWGLCGGLLFFYIINKILCVVSVCVKEHPCNFLIGKIRGVSKPPHPYIFLEELYLNWWVFFGWWQVGGGITPPDRGSTTGAASWTD